MELKPLVFPSPALGGRRVALVYCPPDYAASEARYPVLYLLHGLWGSEWTWLLPEKGNLAPRLAGAALPYLVVCASDGLYGEGSYYTDWFDGSGNHESYFVHDLVDAVDGAFRTVAAPSGRMLAGISWGGYGALTLAMRHPGRFGAAACLSGPLLPEVTPNYAGSQAVWPRVFGPHDGAFMRARSPLHLAERLSAYPRLRIQCGRDDYSLPQCQAVGERLAALGLLHEFATVPGGHDWQCWSAAGAGLLEYAASVLAPGRPP